MVEDLLGAVAVVHIPIDHGHAFDRARGEQVRGGDRHVVEEAEAHGLRAGGVVAGRPDEANGGVQLAAGDARGGVEHAAGGEPGRRQRAGGHHGVGVEGHTLRLGLLIGGGEVVEQGRGMDPQ